MADAGEGRRKRKRPVLLLLLLAVACLLLVIWLVNKAPRTDDAYAYADTIDVVPEVSGRIIYLPVRDNQLARQGDLPFQIDPRPFQDTLAQARASLVALDKEIELRQRTVNAEQYNARSVRAAVARARAAATRAADTLRRMEPLLSPGYVAADDVDRARTAQRATQAELLAAQLQAQQAAAAVSGVDALVAQRAVVAAVDRTLRAAHARIVELREALRLLVGASADNLPDIQPVPLPANVASLPPALSYDCSPAAPTCRPCAGMCRHRWPRATRAMSCSPSTTARC